MPTDEIKGERRLSQEFNGVSSELFMEVLVGVPQRRNYRTSVNLQVRCIMLFFFLLANNCLFAEDFHIW